MKRKYCKQTIALVLVFAMMVGLFPTAVFATENSTQIACSPQTGLSSIYNYSTYDIGEAGTAYINEFSAALHLRRSDLYLGGERLPVDIEFYYDPVNFANMSTSEVNPYGGGWMTSYHQTIEYDSDSECFIYKNANGTFVSFENSGATENGLEKWNEVTTLGIGATGAVLYRPSNVSISEMTSVDIVCDGIYHSFDSIGRLIRLAKGSNQILIDYVDQSLYKIRNITDPVGRQFYFEYSSTENNGVLTQILCKTETGEIICSNEVAVKATYTVLNGRLTSVANTIGDTVTYTYDSALQLTGAANVDGCGYSFNYRSNSNQLTKITARAAMGTEYEIDGTATTIDISETMSIMTGSGMRKVSTFDACGRLTSCELQKITLSSNTKGTYDEEYTCLTGYRLLYATVTREDGTIVNEVTGFERYNANGVIEDNISEETDTVNSDTTEITDSFGNILSSTTTVGNLHQTTSFTYSSDGNYLTSMTDENGNTTEYTYDVHSGNLLSLTDGNGNTTEFSYNATRELANAHLDILGSINAPSLDMDVDYVYDRGRLSQLTYGDYTYDFSYDVWGNVLTVMMNENPLVSYEYAEDASTGRVETLTYGNGKTVYYEYNELDQVISVSYDSADNVRFYYSYDAEGILCSIEDAATNQITTYTDNGYSICEQTGELLYSYTDTGASGNNQTVKGSTYYTTVTQNHTETQETTTKQVNDRLGNSVAYADTILDGFGRLSQKNYALGDTSVYQEFDYANDATGATGSLAEGYHTGYSLNSTDRRYFDYSYNYDGNGNIISVTKTEKYTYLKQGIPDPSPINPPGEVASAAIDSGIDINANLSPQVITTTVSNTQTNYSYDEAGQLLEAIDGETNRTYRYTYDKSGNIQTSHKYSMTGNLVDSKTFSYSNGILTGYTKKNGTQVSYQYDAMGNPVRISTSASTDYTALAWGEGRMLVGVSNGVSNIAYTYNADGLRIGKTITGDTNEETQYVWGPEGLSAVITEDHTVRVMYDASGSPSGFSIDGTPYTYVKNIQGDVIRILDSNESTVVNYKYDPWGVPTVSGTTALAKMNPCSYRGYYYDWDTGYYYLQSRYYDPEIGRFINSDDSRLIGAEISFLSNNLYVYCKNNAVNMVDANGFLGKHWWNSVSFIGSIIDAVLLLIGVVSTNKSLSGLKNLIKRNRSGISKKVWNRICGYFAKLSISWVSTALDIALILVGSSVGNLIARALDYIDPWWGFRRSNGYILN